MEEVAAPTCNKKMVWTDEKRKIMLMTQIVSKGASFFLSCFLLLRKVKAGHGGIKYDRRKTWNGTNGILTMLKTTP